MWVVGASLLIRQRVPVQAGLHGGARQKASCLRSSTSSPPPRVAHRWHEVADYAGCGDGGLQCTSCLLSDSQRQGLPPLICCLHHHPMGSSCISRRRDSGRTESGPSHASSSCASSQLTMNPSAQGAPSPSLKRKQPPRKCKQPQAGHAARKRARLSIASSPAGPPGPSWHPAAAAGAPTPSPALQSGADADTAVAARRPSLQVECSASSIGGEWEDEEGALSLLSSPEEEGAYTISVEIDLCPSPWDHASSSPRLSETLVQIRAHGTVGGLTTNLQYACAVDSLHPVWVLEEWGQLFSLAVILLTAPLCSFTVYTEVNYATDSNRELLLFCRSLLDERFGRGAPVRLVRGTSTRLCRRGGAYLRPALFSRRWVPWVLEGAEFGMSEGYLPTFPFILPTPTGLRPASWVGRVAYPPKFLTLSQGLSARDSIPPQLELSQVPHWTWLRDYCRSHPLIELAVWAHSSPAGIRVGVIANERWAVRWTLSAPDSPSAPPRHMEDWACLWVITFFLTAIFSPPERRRPRVYTTASRLGAGLERYMGASVRRTINRFPAGLDWITSSPAVGQRGPLACGAARWGCTGFP